MKLSLNNLDHDIFKVCATDGDKSRADIVAEGRTLFYEHARKGKAAIKNALHLNAEVPAAIVDENEYASLNRVFQHEHMLYAAKLACASTGETPPADWDAFKRQAQNYYRNTAFLRVLQGIYQEILNPILPRVYSEAIDLFADTVEVGFGETYSLNISSSDIPVFQDSAWGSSWSVPDNRFYSKSYVMNPQPKTCQIVAKWHQLVGNNVDFGIFFANIAAGMYAYTMGLWSKALIAAASNTALVPSGLTGTFSSVNFTTLANKVSALNNAQISNLIAAGNMVALSKVLPTQSTGSANVNMDAAIATLLGADYTRAGYLGVFQGVRLMPLLDAVQPGTQYTSVTTVLPSDTIWLMASQGRKPMTVAYTAETPIQVDIRPMENTAWELGINLTVALDVVSVFASKLAVLSI